jgi:hypothetical protein
MPALSAWTPAEGPTRLGGHQLGLGPLVPFGTGFPQSARPDSALHRRLCPGLFASYYFTFHSFINEFTFPIRQDVTFVFHQKSHDGANNNRAPSPQEENSEETTDSGEEKEEPMEKDNGEKAENESVVAVVVKPPLKTPPKEKKVKINLLL